MSDRDRGWVGLIYHDVLEAGATATAVAQRFAVPVPAFRNQLDALRDSAYHVCSVERAMTASGSRVVAMTFDDGHLGQFTRAFPELAARGMTATFFVTTAWIGRRPGYVSWDQLREMKSAGMSIQSHTHTHPFLSELNANALNEELRLSKQAIDEALDQTTDMIALPGGDLPRGPLRELLSTTGYRVVATSRWGTNAGATQGDTPIYIRRCTVRGSPDLTEFMRIAAGDPAVVHRLGLRAAFLGTVRRLMGASRYARWRALLLQRGDAVRRRWSN